MPTRYSFAGNLENLALERGGPPPERLLMPEDAVLASVKEKSEDDMGKIIQ